MKEAFKPSIAVFLNSFFIHGKGMSGGDQMAIQIFARIRNSFSTLHWFTNLDGKKSVQPTVSGITFSITPSWFDRLPLGLAYVLRALHAIASIKNKDVNIIYSGSDFFPDVLPAYLYTRFNRNVRWVQCIFHIYPHWRTRPGRKLVNFAAAWLQRFSLWLSRRADGIVNINNEVRAALIAKGFDTNKTTIITPGVNLDYINDTPPGNDANVYDAVFLGRLNPSKGISDLPVIWKSVTEQIPRAQLAIIGGGSDSIQTKLIAEFNALGIQDNVDLLGYVETRQVYSILKRARSFIFPSYEEGFGIAIVEAMACAVPVVAWNLPVYAELFQGTVTTVQIGNTQAFAEKILSILRNQEKYTEIVSQARQRAQRYSWQSVSLSMRRWLLQICHAIPQTEQTS